MNQMEYGVLGTAVSLAFLMAGVPVGLALMAGSFLGLLGIFGWNFGESLMILGSAPYYSSASFELCVIPLFVVMGLFSMYTGASEAAYRSAYKWFGRIPGSLAVGTLFATAAFGSTCGASLAVCAIFTKVSLPEMVRRNYNKSIASGTITAGGCLGMLIPPSTIAVVYGILTGVSIGKLFLGGVGPGIFYTLAFSLGVILLASIRKNIAPPIEERFSWKVKIIGLKDFWSIFLLALIVIGGIYTGLFTPTEAGAIGAICAFALFIVNRQFTWGRLGKALLDSTRTTVMIFFVLIGASIFSRMMCLSGLSSSITESIAHSGLPPKMIFVLFLGMYFVMGMFLDSISMMCITLPIVYPLTESFGFDPIWTATQILIMMEIGLLTPPMGLNVYVVKGAAEGQVSLKEVFQGALFFLPIFLLGMGLFFFVPEIITWLPSRMLK
jgi:tripartite ATP-independent transporter DctM subunit